MFSCESYQIKESGIINFLDLAIPCTNYIVVSLIDEHILNNDGYAVRIPCYATGDIGVDLLIPGGDI